MTALDWRGVFPVLRKVSWALFLVCLPVTSFPFFPAGIGGGTLVRPLSVYPMLVLLLIVVIPRLLHKPIPKTLVALMPFILVAIASGAVSMLRDIEPAMGISVLDRTARGLVTLAIGVAFYFTVSLVPLTFEELRASLRWVYAGFSLAMLWGSFQAMYVIQRLPALFHKLDELQRFISIRKLFQTRISGLTYEPNWYAEQISILLIPWLLASAITGNSVFRWRWRRVTIEWLLLGWAVANLVFTYSRAGYLNLIILALLGLLLYRPLQAHTNPEKSIGHRWRWGRLAIEIAALLVVIASVGYLAGRQNTFFSRLWNFWSEKSDTSTTSYIQYIGFGARVTYAETALRIFQVYPVLGVGPGNYAFYFVEMIPDRPLAILPELLRIVSPEPGRDRLITPKNLYFRILAEMGLLGIAAFLAFMIAILGCALYLWLSTNREEKYWGLAGLLGLVVVAVGAISFDSFTLPNMWVVYGLITAATSISEQNSRINHAML